MQFILSANLVLNGPSCTLNAPLILLLLATMLITGFLVYETQSHFLTTISTIPELHKACKSLFQSKTYSPIASDDTKPIKYTDNL